jgi:hypothetical protein
MPDIEDARDLFEELPDVDAGDAAGGDASSAAEQSHDEVDQLAEAADPDGPGHGPTA